MSAVLTEARRPLPWWCKGRTGTIVCWATWSLVAVLVVGLVFLMRSY